MFEKQIYAGNNLHLLNNPANHLKAIIDSVSADLPIPFILDILNLRKLHQKYESDGKVHVSSIFRESFHSSIPDEVLSQLSEDLRYKCKIGLSHLLEIEQANVLTIGRTFSAQPEFEI